MPMGNPLLTSIVNSDSKKGRRYVEICRAQYDAAGLDEKRAQVLNENKVFAAALRALIEQYSMPVAAPDGGRLCVVRVPVDPARDWREAVKAVGPDTGSSWDIWKVGEHYPPQEGKIEEKEIILVNFGKTIPDTEYAINWATPLGLKAVDPRPVFAIAEHKPTLHNELGVDGLAIVSPVPCSFEGARRVPYVWLRGAERVARLGWFGKEWFDSYWFAFSRE